MAIAHVNRAAFGSVAAVGSISSPAANHISGNTLIAFVSRQSSNALTLTDTAGNRWFQAGSDFSNNTNYLSIWYSNNIKGNANNIVTATLSSGTGAYFVIGVRQFSGFQEINPFGIQLSGSGTSGTPATASLTLAGAQGVIFAGIEADGQFITAGSGYSGDSAYDSGLTYFFDEYKIVTASEAPSASCAVSDWRMVSAIFNAETTAPFNDGAGRFMLKEDGGYLLEEDGDHILGQYAPTSFNNFQFPSVGGGLNTGR